MNQQQANAPLIVSAGEPAGIGPDICLGLAAREWPRAVVVVADPEQLRRRADLLSLDVAISIYQQNRATPAGSLCVLPIELVNKRVCGEPDPANAGAVLDGLRVAVEGCASGEFAALVTGPLQKSVINDAGIPFSGHTEFLAGLTGDDQPVMMLVADQLRVALASTHLPLRDVAAYLDQQRIETVLRVLHGDLIRRFGIEDPEIVVCGLNPHAGEGGHLGHEDQSIIAPAIAALQNGGMRLRGPLPADTAFTPAAGKPDAILAMYHDQGLPVVKYAGFGTAVNVTLGLSVVRTSVDHGTALDIAGTGDADDGSLHAAIEVALQMSAR